MPAERRLGGKQARQNREHGDDPDRQRNTEYEAAPQEVERRIQPGNGQAARPEVRESPRDTQHGERSHKGWQQQPGNDERIGKPGERPYQDSRQERAADRELQLETPRGKSYARLQEARGD